MLNVRVPPEASDAVASFMHGKSLRVRWSTAPGDRGIVEGSKNGMALVEAFLAGWIRGQSDAMPPTSTIQEKQEAMSRIEAAIEATRTK